MDHQAAGEVSARVAQPSRPNLQRRAVVVLGMHRSGTSALARVLNILGCAAPKTLLEGDESNAAGYWESLPIAKFNDRVLDAGGSTWHDWQRFNVDWDRSPVYQSFLAEACALLTSEFGASPLILLKDPRTTPLFSFWRSVFAASNISPHCVVALRNPVEVAASLAKRNNFSTLKSLLVWLRYTLDAERLSRGHPRAFVSYNGLLQDFRNIPERLEGPLGIRWPRRSERALAEIAGFLSGDLRHHEARDDRLPTLLLAPWVGQVYETLKSWAEKGETEEGRGILDRIYNDLAMIEQPFGAAIREMDSNFQKRSASANNVLELQRASEIESAKAAKVEEQELSELRRQLLVMTAERDEALQSLADKQAELENRTAELVSSRELARKLQNEKEALAVSGDEINKRLLASRDEFTKAQHVSEQALAARFEEIATLTKAYIQLESEADLVRRALYDAVLRVLSLTSSMKLPKTLRAKVQGSFLKKVGLFQPEWYLKTYPDVRDSAMNPAVHFVRHGLGEGRAPLAGLASVAAERRGKTVGN